MKEDNTSPDLSVQLAPKNKLGLLLTNPIMTASGTFGYGTEISEIFDIQELGAIICKGTTLEPRDGNPQPRLYETSSGVLNSIGLQNIGVEAVIKEKAPVWAGWRVPVIVNITGNTIEEYAQLAEKLDGVSGVSGIEINVSCPNIKEGGATFGAEPEPAAAVVTAVRAVTSLPLIIKLTPNTSDITKVASAVAEAGGDAISLINTLKGMAIDIEKRRPAIGNVIGGLSGPAIKPVALFMVYEAAGALDIPIIGCGGIYSTEDAIEFIMAGACAVQVGSASYRNPCAALDILGGVRNYLKKEGIKSLSEIIGAARQ